MEETLKKKILSIITYNALAAWDCHPPVFSNDIAVFGRFLFGSCSGKRLIDYWVSVGCHMLCLYSGSASFGGCIWRPITSQCRVKAVPSRRLLQMQPTNAPSFPSFWRMHSHYPSWPHISQILCAQKEERKRENGDITWCRSSLSQALEAEIVM